MKNLFFYVSFLVFLSSVMSGCSDSNENDEPINEEDAFLNVSHVVLTFNESDASKNVITIKSNYPWEATTSHQSLKIDKNAGDAGEDKITIKDLPSGENYKLTITTKAKTPKNVISKEITVKRKNNINTTIYYSNNFDKEIATKTYNGSYWPYLDQFNGWDNKNGEGSGTVTYSFISLSVRNDWFSNFNPTNAYRGQASGANNLYFSSANSYFIIENITIPNNQKDFLFTFGCQEANAFNFSHLTISISKDGISWIPLTYSRDNSKEWDLATVSFSLKQEASTLYFRFQTTVSNQIRVDDVKLSSGTTSTNIIDFGNLTQYPLVELPQLNLTINNYQYISHSAILNNRKVRNYTMCFDKNMHAAHWVAYPLHSSYRGGSGRTEAWAADPLIEEQYQPKLYGTDGLTFYRNYSRGHQIPSADRTANDELNNQTFYASNMTPQSGDFNGGIWGTLEGKIRDNICNDTLYVVTGCYFGNNYTTTRDGCNGNNESQVSKDCPVPTHYFKVILRTRSGSSGKPIPECSANELKAIGFWLEHKTIENDASLLKNYCKSVTEIEQLTGIKFFPVIPESVKKQCTPSDWSL